LRRRDSNPTTISGAMTASTQKENGFETEPTQKPARVREYRSALNATVLAVVE
jgi:hypothetical protein